MKITRQWILAVFLSLIALNLCASPASFKAGAEYTILSTPQPTNTGDKVEVIEFFGYFCGYCQTFDMPLAEWAEKNQYRIVFRRVAIGANEWSGLFYTLTAMGQLTEPIHQKIFQAFQDERVRFKNEGQVFDFAASLGIDRNKFSETYRSSAVQDLLQNVEKIQDLYEIESVPTVIIDGRYMTAPAMVAGSNAVKSGADAYVATLKVMDWLVDQAHKNRSTAKKQKKGKSKAGKSKTGKSKAGRSKVK